MDIVAKLEQAKEVIKNGWCKGRYRNEQNRCAVGALNFVCDTKVQAYNLRYLLESQLEKQGYLGTLIQFNDKYSTSKDDVLALFDSAIKEQYDKAQGRDV